MNTDAKVTNTTSARDQPGDPGDREAPFKFEMTVTPDYANDSSQLIEKVAFFQRHEKSSRWQQIEPDARFTRMRWNIGLAMNYHATSDNSGSSNFGAAFTHWGVFLRPVTTDNEEHPYRVFGLNFKDARRKEFILGQKWRTLNRGFQLNVDRSDFKTKEEHNMQVICSFEEFVLAAQLVLREFQMDFTIAPAGGPHGGYAYSLFFNNCQDFALQLLKDIKDGGWESLGRGGDHFHLVDLAWKLERRQEALRKWEPSTEADWRRQASLGN